MSVKFTSILYKLDSSVWSVAVYVKNEYASPLIEKSDRRILCTLNDLHTFHTALMPDGKGDFFININKQVQKKLKLNVNDSLNVSIEKDTSAYGMPLPPELETAWQLDEEAYHVFHKLTIGKQRSLMHYIGKIKSSEGRINKSLILLNYLKEVNGKLDFKQLNEAFKLGR